MNLSGPIHTWVNLFFFRCFTAFTSSGLIDNSRHEALKSAYRTMAGRSSPTLHLASRMWVCVTNPLTSLSLSWHKAPWSVTCVTVTDTSSPTFHSANLHRSSSRELWDIKLLWLQHLVLQLVSHISGSILEMDNALIIAGAKMTVSI